MNKNKSASKSTHDFEITQVKSPSTSPKEIRKSKDLNIKDTNNKSLRGCATDTDLAGKFVSESSDDGPFDEHQRLEYFRNLLKQNYRKRQSLFDPLAPNVINEEINRNSEDFNSHPRISKSKAHFKEDKVADSLSSECDQEIERKAGFDPYLIHSALQALGGCRTSLNEKFKTVHNDLVQLNISGTYFLVRETTLSNNPIVYEKLREDALYLEDRNEYYLERDSQIFRFVHSYLRHGELHLPETICGPLLDKELDLWGIPLGLDIRRCCMGRVTESKWKLEVLEKFEIFFKPSNYVPKVWIKNKNWQKIRDFVWNVLNLTPELSAVNPSCTENLKRKEKVSDRPDKVNEGFTFAKDELQETSEETQDAISESVSAISDGSIHDSLYNHRRTCCNLYITYQLALITISIIVFILSSLSSMQSLTPLPFVNPNNQSQLDKTRVPLHYHESVQEGNLLGTADWLVLLNYLCNAAMMIDLFARACFAPTCRCFITLYNAIDFLSVFPFVVDSFIVKSVINPAIAAENVDQLFSVMILEDTLSFFRLFVVLRIFRLLRRYKPTRVLFYSVRKAFSDMAVLLLLVLILIVFYGSAMYLSDISIIDIPHGMWFAIITLSTVGYGDIVPQSALGCILTGTLIICGILLTSYVVPIVVSNFELYYNHTSQLEYLSSLYRSANQRQLERYLSYLSFRMIRRTRGLIKTALSNHTTLTTRDNNKTNLSLLQNTKVYDIPKVNIVEDSSETI